MRKIIVFNMVTLDGFFAGINGDIDWHTVDEEFNDFAVEQLDTMGALLFGRITYEGMASFWPTQEAMEIDPQVAERMNNLPKIVFSKTLKSVDWQNSRIISDNIAEEIARLKQQDSKDMVIFGSGQLVSSLTNLGLIDEYRLMLNPVVIGEGIPMFTKLENPLKLQLTDTRQFKSGNMLHIYEPVQ